MKEKSLRMEIVDDKYYAVSDMIALGSHTKGYELVKGILYPLCAGARTSYITGTLFYALTTYSKHSPMWVFGPGAPFQCFDFDYERVRRPDAAVFPLNRMSVEELSSDYCLKVVPDIIVEVVSEFDMARYARVKINDWLKSGVKIVWELHPETNEIITYRANGIVLLDEESLLEEPTLLPGFSITVRQIFADPPFLQPDRIIES